MFVPTLAFVNAVFTYDVVTFIRQAHLRACKNQGGFERIYNRKVSMKASMPSSTLFPSDISEIWRPSRESNSDILLRRQMFYPLNYWDWYPRQDSNLHTLPYLGSALVGYKPTTLSILSYEGV